MSLLKYWSFVVTNCSYPLLEEIIIRMKRRLLISVFLFIAGALQAQSIDPTYIFYQQHQNLVNPAVVGKEKGHTISADIRNQWRGMNEAPQTQTFFTTHKITDRVGLGLSVTNNKVFIQKQTGVFADFSYRVPINEHSNIVGGIKFGGEFFNIDISQIRTYNHLYNAGQNATRYDPYLQDISGKFQFNFGAGVYYELRDYYVGLSIPNMLASDKVGMENDVMTSVAENMLYYAMAGYHWHISSDFTLKPSIQIHLAKKQEASTNFTVATDYLNRAEVGLTYRTDKAFSSYVLFNIQNYYLSVGYGFETYFQTHLNLQSPNSHEFLVQVKW